MANTEIIRGDGYTTTYPVFTVQIANPSTLSPINLTSCTVRITFKLTPSNPTGDPNDDTAVIKGTLIVNGSGTPTTQTRLYLVGPATNGTVALVLSEADTLALPLGQTWNGDIEIRDAANVPRTVIFLDTLSAKDGYTNRITG